MKSLLLSTLAFVAFAMQAQNPENTFGSKISFSLGGCAPHGKFKQQNINDSTTGYAKGGVALAIDYTYITKKKWGFYAQYRSNSLLFDYENYATDASKEINMPWSTTARTNYKIRALNFGICNVWPIGERIAITARLGFGSSWCTQRMSDITFKNGNDKYRILQDPVKTQVLNSHIGFEFLYNITERIGLTYKYHYQWQTPIFENTTHLYFNGINFDNTTYNYSQPFNFGTSTIGAVVHF